jgi:hypothetical protein
MKTIWDFIVENYLDYHNSDTIAYSDDLHKLLNKEYEDGDDAQLLLVDVYNGDINNPQIKHDYNEVMVEIYEKAITNYINNSK